jgi:hypothetical protein
VDKKELLNLVAEESAKSSDSIIRETMMLMALVAISLVLILVSLWLTVSVDRCYGIVFLPSVLLAIFSFSYFNLRHNEIQAQAYKKAIRHEDGTARQQEA